MSLRSSGVTKVLLMASYTSAITRSASCSTRCIRSTSASRSARDLAEQHSTSSTLISCARAAPLSSRSKKCSSLGSSHFTARSIHMGEKAPPVRGRVPRSPLVLTSHASIIGPAAKGQIGEEQHRAKDGNTGLGPVRQGRCGDESLDEGGEHKKDHRRAEGRQGVDSLAWGRGEPRLSIRLDQSPAHYQARGAGDDDGGELETGVGRHE